MHTFLKFIFNVSKEKLRIQVNVNRAKLPELKTYFFITDMTLVRILLVRQWKFAKKIRQR